MILMKKIPFSPPDISELEIKYVIEAMKSGWITTGPKTKLFEKKLADYCGTARVVCFNSATAAMEMTLHVLGVGPGDEVITSAYTYTASASVIHHVGAKIVLIDTEKDSFEMDYDQLSAAITANTKVIIPVDIAGIMCDYDRILSIADSKRHLFSPANPIQQAYGRVVVLADAAHSFGASYKGKLSGSVADFTCFSFHAVKCLTTAEGGAVTWVNLRGISENDLYTEYQLLSLHGQSKDALSKTKTGDWEYDIKYLGYKCNMTDIAAAMGIAQLERYASRLDRREEIVNMYNSGFKDLDVIYLDHSSSSRHLYLLRIKKFSEARRNELIIQLAERGIICNVHFKPLPLMSAYINLGYDIKDYPNAYDFYHNVISLPLHTLLEDEDVQYIIANVRECISG